ncbi:MAG: TolC family protein [Pedobacter sp.]|nr:MAG: TolC family protein [Pedobacter sp.]
MKLTKRLKYMVKLILVLFSFAPGYTQLPLPLRQIQPSRLNQPAIGAAKDTVSILTLTTAEELARHHYPLLKQQSINTRSERLQAANINAGWLPQLSFAGQASYQSDVTRVNISVPGISIEAPAKDQYKIYSELNQLLYDGGLSKVQKEISRLSVHSGNQQVEVELYQLKQKVDGLYLGILFLDQLLLQQQLAIGDIETGIKTTTARVDNGVAFRSDLLVLQAGRLLALQRRLDLEGSRAALLENLSVLINRKLTSSTQLEKPAISLPGIANNVAVVNYRPEVLAFEKRDELLQAKRELVTAGNRPKAGLFVQGGYGRPALNMLQNQFDWYYIGGIRFTWNLGSLYTAKKDKELIGLQQQQLNTEKETFILNTNASLAGARAEIQRMAEVIKTDDDIITLRTQVKDAARAQLENGVITSNDYLREINAADQAHQVRITHETQLLKAVIEYNNLQGNKITSSIEK